MTTVVILSTCDEGDPGDTVDVTEGRGRALVRGGAARPDGVRDARELGVDPERADTQVASPAAHKRRGVVSPTDQGDASDQGDA